MNLYGLDEFRHANDLADVFVQSPRLHLVHDFQNSRDAGGLSGMAGHRIEGAVDMENVRLLKIAAQYVIGAGQTDMLRFADDLPLAFGPVGPQDKEADVHFRRVKTRGKIAIHMGYSIPDAMRIAAQDNGNRGHGARLDWAFIKNTAC